MNILGQWPPAGPRGGRQGLALAAALALAAFVARPFAGFAPGGPRAPAPPAAAAAPAFTWEDPEGIAAFIDPRDPAVLAFVRAGWASCPPARPGEFPPPGIAAASFLLGRLAARGLRELPDPPPSPGARPGADLVSRPWETLLSRAGDCEDLAVLACSVLEAARIPTAIAISGRHVFFLIDSGVAAADLDASPFAPGTVIPFAGRVWMPIEATELARTPASFAAAWRAAWGWCGAAARRLAVIDVERAWKRHPPSNPPPPAPALARIEALAREGAEGGEAAAADIAALEEHFASNVAGRLERELEGLAPGPGRERALAAEYARTGLWRPARRSLERVLEGMDPGDAARAGVLSDLGLVLALGARAAVDLDDAVARLRDALAALPPRARREQGDILARLALVHRRKGDLPLERACAREAETLDPAAGTRYLEAAGIAAGEGGASTDE